MQSIGEITQERVKITTQTSKNGGERGEVVKFFFERIEPRWLGKKKLTFSFLAKKLSYLSLQDLYFLRSICVEEEKRGTPFYKTFWGSLRV